MYFGTYSRTMVSMFELVLANWPPICRFLMEDLHEAFMVPVVLYRVVMGLAVLGVIAAVFMQETFKVVNNSDHIMVRNKQRAMNRHRKKMKILFDMADADNSGMIGRQEFLDVMADVDVRTWLDSMDIDIS